MTITYLGELTVGGGVPGAELAVSAGLAGVAPGLGVLMDQLNALVAYTPTPIDFTAQLAVADQIVAGLAAAIGPPPTVTPPSLDDQIAVINAQIAGLNAQIGVINAQVDVLNALQVPLLAAGVHAYAFDGDASELGNELDAAVGGGVPGGGGGGQHANAVIMVTVIPATWDALGEIVKVEP